MKNNNRKETLSKLLPIVLIIAGITVFGTGVSVLASQAGAVRTRAVIEEITEDAYFVGGAQKKAVGALVTYTVGDTAYTTELGGVKKGFAEGGTIDVLVNPEVPLDASLPQTAGGAVCTALGAALLLGGLLWFFPTFRSVLANGRKRNDPIPVDGSKEEKGK